MLRVFWVHGCEPGRVSDGSRLALCQTLSIECPSFVFFCPVYFVILVPFSLSFFCVFVFFFCSHWSLVDVPLIFFCPADHVSDWQPRILYWVWLLFLAFGALVANPKKLLYTVANPARGLLNRGKKKRKSLAEARSKNVKNTHRTHTLRIYEFIIRTEQGQELVFRISRIKRLVNAHRAERRRIIFPAAAKTINQSICVS